MKFSLSAVVFAIGSMAGSSEAGNNLSMRGNTRSANTLMKRARRLDQNYDYGGGYYYGNNQNQNQQYQGQYGNNNNQNQQYQGQYNNNGGNGGNGGYNYNNNYNYNNGNNNQQEEGEEEEQGGEQDYGFLMNYSINLLSCIDGEMVQNYGEENDNNQYETSAVIFRLCPSNTCGSSSSEYSEYGCDEGYGDYIIGINTFMELYQRYEEERQQEQEENNEENNGENNNNGQQQQYNSMVAYNSYGVEFDASEYLECGEYNAEEAMEQAQENGYNYYQNNQNNQNGDDGQNNNNQNNQNYQGGYGYYQNVEVFIGPGCTADGKSIGLKLYMNEQCTYGADKAGIDFATISYGLWDEGLPFNDGGLVSLTCASCSNYNDDGEGEVSELCADAYESSPTQCEDGMNLNNNNYNYGGQYNNNNNNNNGYYYQQQNQQQDSCEYIENLLSTVYASSLSSAANDYLNNEYVQKVMSHREAVFITLAVILGIAVLAGTYCLYRSFVRKCCADKNNAAAGGDENQKYVAANDDADDEAMMSAKAKIAHAESVLQSATGSNKNNELPQEDPEPAVRKSWFT